MIALLIGASSKTEAVEVKDLYWADVVVEGQSRTQRLAAYNNGLIQVLQKISGQEQVGEHELVKKASRSITDYVLQFSFHQNEQELRLRAEYEADKVNRLLRSMELPLWGSRRPKTLLWGVWEQGINRRLIADENSALTQSIKQAADAKGLPLVLPLGDLQDMSEISLSDVWGRFSQPVAQASRRYKSDNFVMVRAYTVRSESQQEAWKFQWRLVEEGMGYDGEAQAETIEQGIDKVLNALVDRYVSQQAVDLEAQSQQLTITVVNCSKLQQTLAVEHYLKSLALVDSVYLSRVYQGKAEFLLTFSGSRKSLERVLGLDSKLEKIFDPLAPETLASTDYHWTVE